MSSKYWKFLDLMPLDTLFHISLAHNEVDYRTQDDEEKRKGFHMKQLPELPEVNLI